MRAQLDQLAALLGQEVVKRKQARDSLKEKGKLFLDQFRLLDDLPVSPTEYSPPLVNQAVLPKKIVLVLFGRNGFRGMPHEAVDLKRNPLIRGPQSVIDGATAAVDVLNGV